MNTDAPPVLTVLGNGSKQTFRAGHDVIVGSDLRADVRITHPLISRTHLLLRFDKGRWLAIDNGSPRGTFVDRRRARVVDLCDGRRINIGNPDGPSLTFEINPDGGAGGAPPTTHPIRGVPPQRNRWRPRTAWWVRGARNEPPPRRATPDPPTMPAAVLPSRPSRFPEPRTGPVAQAPPQPVEPNSATMENLVVERWAGEAQKPEVSRRSAAPPQTPSSSTTS